MDTPVWLHQGCQSSSCPSLIKWTRRFDCTKVASSLLVRHLKWTLRFHCTKSANPLLVRHLKWTRRFHCTKVKAASPLLVRHLKWIRLFHCTKAARHCRSSVNRHSVSVCHVCLVLVDTVGLSELLVCRNDWVTERAVRLLTCVRMTELCVHVACGERW